MNIQFGGQKTINFRSPSMGEPAPDDQDFYKLRQAAEDIFLAAETYAANCRPSAENGVGRFLTLWRIVEDAERLKRQLIGQISSLPKDDQLPIIKRVAALLYGERVGS